MAFGAGSSRELVLKYVGDTSDLKKTAAAVKKSVQSTVDDATKSGQDAGKGFSGGLTGIIKGVFAGGAILGLVQKGMGVIKDTIGDAIAQSDATDKFKATLKFAGMSAGQVAKLVKVSQAYADATVYDLADIQNGTAQLAANGVKNADRVVEAMGNLNAVAGGNADTFKSVTTAVTQTAGAGKLTTENWNQLADAIPGASGILQNAMKKNGAYTGDFREAMAKGEITADEFMKAIQQTGMTKAAKEAATSTKTIEGAWGNFQASLVGGLAKIITALKPTITAVINGLAPALDKVFAIGAKVAGGLVKLVAWVKKYKDVVGPAAAAVGFLVGYMIAYNKAMAIKAVIDQAGGLKALRLATKAQIIEQIKLNAAMFANPIGIVVLAVAALVAGFIIAYKKSETFRKIVNAAWSGIKAGALAVWNWFKGSFLPFFTKTIPDGFKSAVAGVKKAWSVVTSVVTAPFKAAKTGVTAGWKGITGAFTTAKNWVSGTWKKGWSAVSGWVSGAVGKGRDAVGKAWTTTRGKFSDAKSWVSGTWRKGWSAAKDWISGPIKSGRDAAAGFLDKHQGLQSKLSGMKSWASTTFKKSWSGAKLWISDPVQAGKNSVTNALDATSGIRAKFNSVKSWAGSTWKKGWAKAKGWIGGAVSDGKDAVGTALGRTGIRDKFNGMKTWVSGTWKKGWKNAKGWISDPIGSAKDTIHNQLGYGGTLRGIFNGFDNFGRKTFGKKWDGMKAKLRAPIDAALAAFKSIFGYKGKARTVFNGFIDAVKGIFGKLKGAVTTPIKSVIGAINTGLIKGGINWILKKLGVKTLVPWIPVPTFAEGGRSKGANAWQRGGTDRMLAQVDHDEMHVKRDSTRKLDRELPGGLDYMNATGKWPVGPAAETYGADQQARPGPGVPVNLSGVPGNLRDIARRGPRAGDPAGFGGVNPVGFGMSHVGQMGWYNRCLNFVNQAWAYTVGRFRLGTARQSMGAGPRNPSDAPPAGAGVYWDTGPSGHIALAGGDGTVFSNDIRQAGRIDRVPLHEVDKWGPYMGWWHPNGATGGTSAGGISGVIGNILGFLGKLSPVEWLKKKAGEIGKKSVGGGAFGAGLLSSIPTMLIDKAKDWIAAKMSGGADTWTGGKVAGWNSDQLNNAATIISVAKSLGFGDRGALIGLMTSMQESTLNNLNYGDRDSLGLFQQRAPWGSAADRTNPAKAARMFYLGGQGGQPGLKSKDWQHLGLAQAAQAVQVSAYPDAYAKWEPQARALVAKATSFDTGGKLATGLSLVHNGTGQTETVRTARQEAALDQAPITINIYGALDENATARKIITLLNKYDRSRNGVKINRRTAAV